MAADASAHRVVIVGGGFAGMQCGLALRRSPAQVTLLDKRNFHLFQPLLYQVATGALSPANIAAPLRGIFKRQANARTLLDDVTGFDLPAKEVETAKGGRVPFDSLVFAAGSIPHYFGKDAEWEPHAPGLKTVEDATLLRQRILSAFERAERDPDANNRRKYLTFVVVGGGPTGVEMAGAIRELAKDTLRKDFRSIDPAAARVILVENSDHVLEAFPEKSQARALKALEALGVEPMLGGRVTGITANQVTVSRGGATETIDTETVVWAAGVKATPLGKLLADATGVTVDRGGRVPVNPDCSVGGHPNVFVIGDAMSLNGPDGKPLPGVAPVAMQQGRYVADVIDRRLRGKSPLPPFRYHDKGSMATIGRSRAVAVTNGFQLSGWLAWMAWLFIHIMYLARFENRLLVLMQWFWNYVTRNRAARLITHPKPD